MQLNLPLDRRQRATALGLASLAAAVFLIFITRVFLLGPPEPPPRTCGPSAIYQGLTLTGAQFKYHFIMESLVEERMNLYEGTTVLACNAEAMEGVIPPGEFAAKVAETLRQTNFTPAPPRDYLSPFTYTEFEKLLTEFWRTYDCHLFSLQTSPGLLGKVSGGGGLTEGQKPLYTGVTFARGNLEQERLRARHTLSRLLFTLRSSEQYLPLHASLRCLQRGGVDIRNALALISDANQCIRAKLGQPKTSLLQ